MRGKSCRAFLRGSGRILETLSQPTMKQEYFMSPILSIYHIKSELKVEVEVEVEIDIILSTITHSIIFLKDLS
jgi:hypothetical protein